MLSRLGEENKVEKFRSFGGKLFHKKLISKHFINFYYKNKSLFLGLCFTNQIVAFLSAFNLLFSVYENKQK
jgi:hypothetical protein